MAGSHEDPVPRLGELIELHHLYFGKSLESERVSLRGRSLAQMTSILRRAGYLRTGRAFAEAFQEFVGNENFEERADRAGAWIDKPVMKHLVKKFGK